MAKRKISESPVNSKIRSNFKTCAKDALAVLKLKPGVSTQKKMEALDEFVYRWQKGKQPPAKVLGAEDAPFIMGSLWGELLIKQLKWDWVMITFHEHDDSIAPGVASPDRSMVIYPIHFLTGCFENPDVDATIALSYNMLIAGSMGKLKPKGYLNVMDSVHRIVPRD